MFPEFRRNRWSLVEGRWAALCLIVFAQLAGNSLPASYADEPAGAAPSMVLTSFEAIRQIPEGKKKEVYSVRLDYLVYYHDPAWKVAWGDCAGVGNYLTLGALPFVVKPGQRILVEGRVVPASGLMIDDLQCTLISEAVALPEALPTKNALGQSERFNKRWVQVEGFVDKQTVIDRNHLKVDLVSEGRAVTVRLLLDESAPPPELQGTIIRVQGVYSAKSSLAADQPLIELWVPSRQNLEVIGIPVETEVARPEQRPISSYEDFLQIPENKKQDVHRIQLDFLVYFHDPRWKVAWGGCASNDIFIPLGELPKPVKPGQRVILEGQVLPANGWVINELKVSPIGDPIPLNPLPTKGRLGDAERFDKHPVVVEAYVDQQSKIDNTHFKVDLVSEGRAVTVRLLLDGQPNPPELEGAKIRVRGVYSATIDPTTGLPKIELWVQGQENIEVIGALARDELFEIASTPIEKLGTVPVGKLVRVDGFVRAQQPGKSLTIRDDTGQVTMLTAQSLSMQLGERVEAIGVVAPLGADGQLRDCLYRRAKYTPNDARSGKPAVLRLTEQVRELSSEEAERRQSVQLTGVVTWVNSAADFFFINDSSGGICVRLTTARPDWLLFGKRVNITGTTAAGDFTPLVIATSVVSTATIDVPVARQVTLEQALTGIEDSQWVAMSGYVRSVLQEEPWGRLELTTSAGEFKVNLPWTEELQKLRGAVVRVNGVCSVLTNGKRQLTGIRLWVQSAQSISVEEAEPTDPYSVVVRPIAGLRQYNALSSINRRVRVVGVVVHQVPGEVLFIQEGTEGLLVLSRDRVPLLPGDRVEVVGFPGRERNRAVLREAVYRKLAAGEEPKPQEITAVDPIDIELDGRLVRLQALLLDPGTQGESNRLLLQARNGIFEAVLDTKNRKPADHLVAGSLISLTGVYQVDYDAYNRPHAVKILLRSPLDVAILRRPSWLTLGRALAAIGLLTFVLLAGFAWVVALRRRVQRQTEQIRVQVESEKAARLEVALARAAKLESLGVLAGGIAHDFNNLLTVVLGNLSLVKLDTRIESESVECLQEGERAALRARDLTQQLITFAKGGEPVRAVTSLPEVVREATKFALHGSNVRCDFDMAADIWPAFADKGQISQVVHNLIINASHAMPNGGVIRIKLYNEEVTPGFRVELKPGRYLRMVVADSGTGISSEHLKRIFEPYFTTKAKGHGLGLATVYSIVNKHQGLMEVESALGVGTTFHLWLPASSVLAEATSPVSVVTPAPESAGRTPNPRTARVLIMDDDESIRQLGAGILKRMGIDCTGVSDGAAMLHEYETARRDNARYDLVILDLTVPGGMGGAEAMIKLLQLDPAVRAIVSSGYSGDAVMANYRTHGFSGAVTKPFEITEFMKTVRGAIADPVN